MEKSEKKLEWYNDPSMVTNIVIGLILINILLSQSFAIKNDLSAASILSSILTHNVIYIFLVFYFVFLKTKSGKKYFDYLNLLLILIYILITFTSLLSVFQSFNLPSIIGLCIHLFFVLYLVHTFFRGTRLWKELKLNKSPFNEFSNDNFYYIIVILAVILLAVNLIMTTSIDGTILSLLDCGFVVMFGRYIYLYWKHLDDKKINCINKGNFDKFVDKVEDEVKDKVTDVKEYLQETSENISDKINNFVDVDKISDTFNNTVDKVADLGDSVKGKVEDFIESHDIDDKFDDAKEKVVEFGKDIVNKVDEVIDENKLDEKIDEVKDKVEGFKNDVTEKIETVIESEKKKKKRRKKKTNKEDVK